MDKLIKKTFLATIGFLSATEEKFKKNIDLFVKKGKLTEKEAKEMFEQFKEKYKDFFKDIEKKIDIQIEKVIEKAGLVRKDDLKKLEERLKKIEEKLNS